MKDYATIPNTLGTYPNVTGKNASSGTATDGTPYIAQFIDDLWGFSQALMNEAGLTPDGVTESASASQRMQAMKNCFGHPGEVIAWMGDEESPPLDDIRLLPLNGQGILRASYTLLDDTVYVGDAANPTAPAFYHADDAAGTIRNTTGVWLITPDLRGYFLRGYDVLEIVDEDGSGRAIGDSQEPKIGEHYHDKLWTSPNEEGFQYGQKTDATYGTGTTSKQLVAYPPDNPIYTGYANQAIGGADIATKDNRPWNSACRWCIRY